MPADQNLGDFGGGVLGFEKSLGCWLKVTFGALDQLAVDEGRSGPHSSDRARNVNQSIQIDHSAS